MHIVGAILFAFGLLFSASKVGGQEKNKIKLAMLRSSLSNFGIFVFVFHVKTSLGVEPKTTHDPKVVKKKQKHS
jgi:hypothetical protein